jgi:hypothetical protein
VLAEASVPPEAATPLRCNGGDDGDHGQRTCAVGRARPSPQAIAAPG